MNIVIYEQCQSCKHQSQKEMKQGGSFSTAKCEKCGSENVNVQMGGSNKPEWWKK